MVLARLRLELADRTGDDCARCEAHRLAVGSGMSDFPAALEHLEQQQCLSIARQWGPETRANTHKATPATYRSLGDLPTALGSAEPEASTRRSGTRKGLRAPTTTSSATHTELRDLPQAPGQLRAERGAVPGAGQHLGPRTGAHEPGRHPP